MKTLTFSGRHPAVLIPTVLLSLGTLWACSPKTDFGAEESLAESSAAKIDWYEGDVESAFALAKSAGKPLFLYWGAEWCPPCHYLKNKVFTRPEFIDRMQAFIPVYLDGDTARAQILGEELDVKGYPTVLIFDPTGQEVMRMPSTIAIDQYEIILDAATENMKPVRQVLDEVLASGPAQAEPTDLHLLAFYSWDQDSQVALSLEEQVAAFQRLLEETPTELTLERSRFLGLYLVAVARQTQNADSEEPALSEEERTEAQQAILEILEDPQKRNANLLWIVYYADSIIDLLQPEDTPARHELLGAWQQAAEEMENDASLSVDDRLTATRLRVDFVKMAAHPDAGDATIPPALQDHVRARAAWAVETVTSESELQSVVNTLAYLLEDAGLSDEAESMLLEKMHDTAAPYYFMSWIASLKLEAGDDEAALEWYRKAYDASEGRYSRFRWGSTYLRQLMKLSPQSVKRIEADSIEVLTELLANEDAFAGGNYARLDGLQSAYWKWNEDGQHDAELATIRDHVLDSCERYPAGAEDSQQQRCEGFLSPEEVQGDAAM